MWRERPVENLNRKTTMQEQHLPRTHLPKPATVASWRATSGQVSSFRCARQASTSYPLWGAGGGCRVRAGYSVGIRLSGKFHGAQTHVAGSTQHRQVPPHTVHHSTARHSTSTALPTLAPLTSSKPQPACEPLTGSARPAPPAAPRWTWQRVPAAAHAPPLHPRSAAPHEAPEQRGRGTRGSASRHAHSASAGGTRTRGHVGSQAGRLRRGPWQQHRHGRQHAA